MGVAGIDKNFSEEMLPNPHQKTDAFEETLDVFALSR